MNTFKHTFEPRFGILHDDFVETRQKLIQWLKNYTNVYEERILSDMNRLGCYELLIDACQTSQGGIDGYYDDCLFALEKYNQLDRLDIHGLSQICLIPPYNQFKDIHCQNNIIFAFTCTYGDEWTARAPYIMIMHPQLLYQFVGKLSVRQLALRLQSQQTKCNVVLHRDMDGKIESKARHLKKLRVDDIQQEGSLHLEKLFAKHPTIVSDSKIQGTFFPWILQLHYCFAEYRSRISLQYDVAKEIYVSIICSTDIFNNALFTTLSLIALSRNCLKNGEYVIGRKVLKYAFIICNGYFLKSFYQHKYAKKKTQLLRKLKTVHCAYCSKSYVGEILKCCVGCMQTFYCSKKCQKKHWMLHKKQCNMTWIELYYMLKKAVFERVLK
eukprot:28963_1